MPDPTNKQASEKLQAVFWPGFDQDIVAAGFVVEIDVRDGAVRVGSALRSRRMDKAAAIEEGIRKAVSSRPGMEPVGIRRIESEVPLIPEVGRNPQRAGRGTGTAMAADALR